MAKTEKFAITDDDRAGIKRAAEWHDYMANIFRDAIKGRQDVIAVIGYWEHLMNAETHEFAARDLRALLDQK